MQGWSLFLTGWKCDIPSPEGSNGFRAVATIKRVRVLGRAFAVCFPTHFLPMFSPFFLLHDFPFFRLFSQGKGNKGEERKKAEWTIPGRGCGGNERREDRSANHFLPLLLAFFFLFCFFFVPLCSRGLRKSGANRE